ncbi:MAG: hypothetical protein EZS28_028501 [Streblomastix strix]|uniref:Uncharacterized protein n=1 Tax=Streblomastix strix TaxID=222440 RepID=A0A5J4V0Q1_9EUKA|nr:MAG: hypothetical protein EZS28_028501 [Streblomastix strix]
MDRVHFCSKDTDSMYLAISGSQIEGYKKQFKHIIMVQEFWYNHYKEWLPWEGCSIAEEKKLLGCAIEIQREGIICLAPKCYSAIDGEIEDVIRMKGINEKNSSLTRDDYIKTLTGIVDKMIVIDSDISKGQSYTCAPQIMNVDASSYHYQDNI